MRRIPAARSVAPVRMAARLLAGVSARVSLTTLWNSSRGLSATLAGTGLDLRALRLAHEAHTQSGPTGQGEAVPAVETSAVASHPAASSATDATATDADANAMAPRPCVVRGRVERVRGHGKLAFLHLRQPPGESVQVVCFGKALAAQARAITPESVVDVTGEMRVVGSGGRPIHSTTCAHHELHAHTLHVRSAAAVPLPFPLQDMNTKLDTRLNHRSMDLRTRLTSAVLRIVSAVCQSYRSALLELEFVEVHTPKLIAAASEGGSAVFEVRYFDAGRAYLAQSPQLYKQMCLNGDAMRVFEIGPVFRAEQSLTHRHLTEFTGLDAEMVIQDSYTEVLDVLEYVMCRIVYDLQDVRRPHAALVRVATDALREQAEAEAAAGAGAGAGTGQEAMSPSIHSAPSSTRTPPACTGASVADLVCEVSEETVVALGLGCDAAGDGWGPTLAAATAADPYRARIGGGRLERAAPGEPVACPRVLRLAFDDAVRLMRDADALDAPGVPVEDFSLREERRLGALVKARYGVDLYVVDQWPASARPFYTMPCTAQEVGGDGKGASAVGPGSRTRSYDMYLRGEEICSGAQRQHDAARLTQRLAEMGISLADSSGSGLRDYVDSFRYGAWPHGGFGLGLERIVAFFLNARDIRQVSLFPRDPKRLTP